MVSHVIVLIMVMFAQKVSAEEGWITDGRTGCKFDGGSHLFSGTRVTIEWSGNCREGKADGAGTVRWFTDGIHFWSETFSKNAGVLLKAGKRISVLDEKRVQLSMLRCDKRAGYRRVEARIPAEVDARQRVLIDDVLGPAERLAWEKCPAKRAFSKKISLDNVAVSIIQNGKEVASARSYPGDMIRDGGRVWQEYRNASVIEAIRKAEQKVAAARAARQKKRVQAQQKARRVAEERRQMQITERRSSFAKRYGVTKWVGHKELSINPFQFEGEVVALRTRLSSMLTATGGVFSGDVVVSKIPRNEITDNRELVIAGKVTGNTSVKTPFGGEALMPNLEFRGVYFCQEAGCKDIVE